MNIYFSENLKRLRKERNLTQETLADFLGVTFQAISKWERGEGYPDITTLPAIASFFGTSVDDLLGIDKSKRERKANEYILMFDELRLKDREYALNEYENAVREFPRDFRISVRYMELLCKEKLHIYREDFDSTSSKIESIFNVIMKKCTDDGIRIWAKRLMCEYLKYKYDCCGYDEAYMCRLSEIIDTMPSLCDSKEILTMSNAGVSDWNTKHEAGIEELLYLLMNALTGYCINSDDFSAQYKIGVINSMNELFGTVDREDRYGKNRIYLIYNHGRLGRYYYEIGDVTSSVKYLALAADEAAEFDRCEGAQSTYRFYETEDEFKEMNMKKRMKKLMTEHYGLPEEFLSTDSFSKILAVLDTEN